jgi:exosome complex component RRP41
MQHSDILNLAGLRVDGRLPADLRRLKHKLGSMRNVDGSCYLEQGLNKVLVTVLGPVEQTRQDGRHADKGTVTVTIAHAAFSGTERKARRHGDRRVLEMEGTLQQSLEGVVCLELYARSDIRVNVNVLEADGSLVCTVMNAACLALMDAGINMTDMLCACSSGFVKQLLCTDLNQVEQGSGAAYLPVAIKATSEEVVYMQLDARLGAGQLESALETAMAGCRVLREYMSAAIRETMMEQAPEV